MVRAVWFHRLSALTWALASVPALLFWQTSVLFVIIASIYANVKSDWTAAVAADDRTVLTELCNLREEIAALRAELRGEAA